MDINEALMVIPRSIVSIICLFVVTKIIGKRQVSELSLFDYVIGISIGNFAAEMIINTETQFIDGVVATFIFGIFAYIVNLITRKSIIFRRFLTGIPTIIIDNGKLIENGFKKTNIDINDLLEQCRLQGYFDINDISYAIMEANGSISILPKTKKRPIVLEDLDLNDKKECLVANIIIDGKIMKKALKILNITENNIHNELKKQNINNIDNILLGTYKNDEYNFYIKNIDSDENNLIE